MKRKRIIIILAILTVIIGSSIFYFKKQNFLKENEEIILSDNALAFYLRQPDGTYKETVPNGNKWPNKGYRLNYVLSGCVDSNGDKIPQAFSYVQVDKKLVFTTNRATFCYLYFDEDSDAPAIKSFSIDKEYTNSLTNSFYLDWEDDDVKFYCITNTPSTSGCTWKPVIDGQKSITASFTLDGVEAPSTWYAYIKDDVENESEPRSDNIVYDKTPPTFTISNGGKSYYYIIVKVTNESDNLSGVNYNTIYYKRDNNAWEVDNQLQKRYDNLSQSTGYTFYVRLCDNAGNCSSENNGVTLYTDSRYGGGGSSLRPTEPGGSCCIESGYTGDEFHKCYEYIYCGG